MRGGFEPRSGARSIDKLLLGDFTAENVMAGRKEERREISGGWLVIVRTEDETRDRA